MNTLQIKLLAVAALSTLSFSALASTYDGSCTSEPKSKWMTTKDMQAKFEKQGYNVGRVKAGKADSSCYEVYTKDKNGKKVELFVNPVDGTVIKEAGK